MTTGNQLRFMGAFAAIAMAPDARADQLTLTEKPGHVTEATVTVDATPAEVYAMVTDYAQWRTVFHDVISVSVKSGGRHDAKVRFKSQALQHEVTVVFDNVPDQWVRFRGVEGPPGGRASGSYELTPVDDGKRTRVRAHLYMDVVGLPGLFIGDSKVRSMREAKLRADMTDVMRRFSPPQAQVSAQSASG